MPRIAGLEKASVDRYRTKNAPAESKDKFTVLMADQILLSTKQYGRWKTIRETDPARATRLARIVMERHDLFDGRGGLSADRVDRFDRLTKDLRKEGIHLFTSSQLREIVPGVNGAAATVNVPGVALSGKPSNAAEHSFSGRYSNLDCFQFVAAVLEENGIRYYGKNGAGNALIKKAVTEHKPSNSFLTGEGVTQLLSSESFTLTVKESSFQGAWKKIEPRLKEGSILSFSSRRFGHTGIVGKRNGRWMLIHSSGTPEQKSSYRVKEEDLAEEIRGWLEKAKKEKDFLSITVGQVDRDLAAAYNMPEPLSPGKSEKAKVNLFARGLPAVGQMDDHGARETLFFSQRNAAAVGLDDLAGEGKSQA
jgi:hypothetical protein